MPQETVLSSIKRKPASLIGAPISAQETAQLKKAFAEKYPSQVPSVFISKELILNSMAGVSNVSGILFSFGLNEAGDPSSRSIVIIPCRDKQNGGSAIIPVIHDRGYLCDNGGQIDFERLLTILANHVTDFKVRSL
jgi:hypothetical protein